MMAPERRYLLLILSLGLLLGGCMHRPPSSTETAAGTPPSLLLGDFEDDYGIRYTITLQTWRQHPATTFHLVRWEPEGRYLIARNDADNPGDGGLWTRIDWVELSGMPPYRWAFCLSAYDAPTAAEAEATTLAVRETPRTGCNGYPFSRMRPSDRENR